MIYYIDGMDFIEKTRRIKFPRISKILETFLLFLLTTVLQGRMCNRTAAHTVFCVRIAPVDDSAVRISGNLRRVDL